MLKPNRTFFYTVLFLWSLFSLMQWGEIFAHPDALMYHELWLALFLMASFSFFTLLSLPLSIISFGVWLLGRRWAAFKTDSFRFYSLLGMLFLWVWQCFMLDSIYYEASVGYWGAVFVGGVLFWGIAVFLKPIRSYVCFIGFVVLIVLLGYNWGHQSHLRWNKKPKGPNVVVFLADTLRQDHTSFNGYKRETTPHLKALAKEGVNFNNFISTSSWTKPAMAMLFSAKYLLHDSVQVRALPVSFKGTRLPEYFYQEGYDTSFFSANPNTGTYYRAAKGFKNVVQPKPASHFPLYRFILPRFLKYYAGLPKRVQFENIKNRLQWYREAMGFYSLESLASFSKGVKPSPKASFKDQKLYRRQVQVLWPHYVSLKKAVENHQPWKKNFFIPLAEKIYKWTFESSFIWVQGSNGQVITDHWLSDKEVADSFLNWLEKDWDSERPFLAHMQFMGPHSPYQEQPPYLLPEFDRNSDLDLENPPAKHVFPSQGAPQLEKKQLRNLIANYDNAIRATDFQIQRVVETLEKKGLLENTILVFLSDHGEAFYEHKIYDHMYSLYSEMTHVPLFFYWKDKIKPQKTDIPATIVDLFPTLVRLAGLPEKGLKNLDGVSLFSSDLTITEQNLKNRLRWGSVLLGTKPLPMTGLQNKFDGKNKEGHQNWQGLHRMVIRGGFKLVHEIEGESIQGNKPKDERLFLFKLSDKKEPLNPVGLDNEIVRSLFKEFKSLPASIHTKYDLKAFQTQSADTPK